MGKKGSWFSAIKRAFTPNTIKEKPLNEVQGKKTGKKKWGLGKLRHHGGDTSTFSSIEKILSDVDAHWDWEREREQQPQPLPLPLPLPLPQQQQQQQQQQQPQNNIPPKPILSSTDKTPSVSTRRAPVVVRDRQHHLSPIPNNHAAIKIQAAYRAYMARRSFRALKGLVRLQGVVRGQSVKRQTMNAMKQMQLLVKVQSQIHSRRINMLESQARYNPHKNDLETSSLGGRFRGTLSQTSETDRQDEEWDDSVLTKEEINARNQRKVEAIIKKERALAYTDSLQWLKARSAQTALTDIRSGRGFPWWWTWIERQLPDRFPEAQATPSKCSVTRSPAPMLIEPSPQRTPQSNIRKQPRIGVENFDSLTPRSSKSASVATTMTRARHAPIQPSPRTPLQQTNSSASTPVKHLKPRRTSNGADFSFDVQSRDNESLTSCPPFSVPNYMAPTVSAKAKVRAFNAKEEMMLSNTPDEKKKRRMSFPLTQSIGSSIRWNKAYSLFSSKDTSSQLGKHNKSFQSISNFSVDSSTSMPATVGRKPFNRFV